MVADMAGLQDEQVLAVVGMRSVPVRRHNAAGPAVIEQEGAEVLGQLDEGVALVLVRAEGARRHYLPGREIK